MGARSLWPSRLKTLNSSTQADLSGLIRAVESGYLRLANQLEAKTSFSLLDRLLVNHRIAFRLADITLEPLTHLLGELLIRDEAAKVIGKLIVEYRLET